jgi:2-keto-4-pentenoate hydratase/2-oxohepta-3-ene-1,7-dioic acid hydratase in catechol pathway
MKLAQFKLKGSADPRLGVLRGEEIADITELAPDMLTLIRRGPAGLGAVKQFTPGALHPLDAVDFLPAVHAGKILAIGRNYVEHAKEEGSELPQAPLVFNKLTSALSGHGGLIRIPVMSEQVDFEAELAVVIGLRAKLVTEADALECVFGYTAMNDVSARDLQFGDGQWVRGKGLDTFAPLGPFITTRDEVPDPHALRIEGLLNGELMQSSHTSRMLFKIPQLISFISQGITLEPGDVIATGTPDGVGAFRKPPVFLKRGDVFEVAIEGLSTLRNPVGGT